MRTLIFLFGLFFFASSTQAQVATASLDSLQASDMPAASSWRFSSSFGVKADYASGKSTLAGEDTGDTIRSNGSYLLAQQSPILAWELYHAPQKLFFFESTSDAPTLASASENQLHVSFLLGKRLSVGAVYHTIQKDTRSEDATGDFVGYDHQNIVKMGGSATLRIGDSFFIAGGLKNATETGDAKESTTSTNMDKVSNTWIENYWGVGILTGRPGKFQFRLEASQLYSSRSAKEATSTELANTHPQESTIKGEIEIKFDSLFFSYHTTVQSKSEESGETFEQTRLSRYGIGWVSWNGLAISAYATSIHIDDLFASNGQESPQSGYQFNLGYNF